VRVVLLVTASPSTYQVNPVPTLLWAQWLLPSVVVAVRRVTQRQQRPLKLVAQVVVVQAKQKLLVQQVRLDKAMLAVMVVVAPTVVAAAAAVLAVWALQPRVPRDRVTAAMVWPAASRVPRNILAAAVAALQITTRPSQ
jgi:hypothetical protein